MSDKVDMIAIAQLAVSDTGISFNCNSGFKTASLNSPGNYTLELKKGHRTAHLVVNATPNSQADVKIEASLLSDNQIQILTFDGAGDPINVPFFVTVWHVDD